MEDVIEGCEAIVKWFNPVKGFGFVAVDGYDTDAFLHISILSKTGRNSLYPNTKITCDIIKSDRGILVNKISDIILSDESPKEEELEGVIKFFNYAKGFGFVTPDNGSEDVYLGRVTLKLAGIKQVAAGQRVKVKIYIGSKGLTAESICLL